MWDTLLLLLAMAILKLHCQLKCIFLILSTDAPCFHSQLITWEAMGGAGQRKQEAILKKEIEQVAIVDHVIMMRMRRLNLQYFI